MVLTHLIFFKFFKGAGAVVVTVPDSEGLEYTVGKDRLHFNVETGRGHYTPAENRLHYSVADDE